MCSREVVVTRRAGTASDRQLLATLRLLGHRASVVPMQKTVLLLSGTERAGCRQRVCSALRCVGGVRQVENPTPTKATVIYDSRRVKTRDLVSAARRVGVVAKVQAPPKRVTQPVARKLPAPQVRPAGTTTTASTTPSR